MMRSILTFPSSVLNFSVKTAGSDSQPFGHSGVKLSLGKNQVRVGLKLVADAGVGRAGGPEEDDFGGRAHLARTERERMTGVGHLRHIEPENIGIA